MEVLLIDNAKMSGDHPEKNLGRCYPVKISDSTLKNLRWHPENHFEGSRLNGQELCYADCLIYKSSPTFIVCILIAQP